MKLNRILILLAAALSAVGCYENFDDVPPRELYTDDVFATQFPECNRITVSDLKAKFGEISNTGVNSAWSNTKYIQIEEDLYIKGKVTSDDEQGNIYQSLYVQDHTGGIEVKLTTGNYLRYRQGQWVYVRLQGLYLGNYRMMLSLGGPPTESYNKADEHKYYANSAITNLSTIAEHVFAGEQDELVVGSYDEWKADPYSVDIITVTADNYKTVLSKTKSQRESMFGRLIRFEGLTHRYAGVPNQDGVTNPALKSGSYENIYPSWIYTDPRPTVTKGWYHWAYSVDGNCLYGSTLFTYNTDAAYCSEDGVYTLRTSGYSRYAKKNVARDGEKATVTAIYGIYAQRSDYTGGSNDYASYQLSVSRLEDIEFERGDAAILTDDEVDALTTDDMKTVPWIDEDGEDLID